MKLTDLFVKRPVLAIVVNLVILIAGLQSVRSLSVRQYPRSDIAIVTVTTVYTGANANLVRGFITTPLERVIASADGIDYVESSSAQGASTITVHLKLNYDTNAALTQIQAKVAQVRNNLPPEAEAPVIDLQTADNQFAAMYLGFASKNLDQNQITDYLTRVVQPKLWRSAAFSAPTSWAIEPSRCASGSSPTRWPPWASRRHRCATPCRRTTTSPRWAGRRDRWCR
jgi:multidrug efflux pump